MPITRSTFETQLRDEAEQYFASAYKVSLSMDTPSGGLWRYHRLDAGRFALDTIAAPMDLLYEAVYSSSVMVSEVVHGRIEHASSGNHSQLQAGDVFLTTLQPSIPHACTAYFTDTRLTTIDAAVMAQVLGIPLGDPVPALRFSRIRPKSPAATALWKRMLTFAWALLDNPSQVVPPLMVDTLLRSLCSVAISIFPNEMNVGRPYDAGDAHPPAIRRAVAFIETNAQQEISLSDIVAAANVGPRAVQLGFRRYLNTTPMQYLRRVRLAHAHDALKAADPDTDTVAAIARRWGFADLGRFQRMYRDAYGLGAGQTLRR